MDLGGTGPRPWLRRRPGRRREWLAAIMLAVRGRRSSLPDYSTGPLAALGQALADLPGDFEYVGYFFGGGAEVYEADAQAGVAVHGGGGQEKAAVALHLAGEPGVVFFQAICSWRGVAEADGGEHGVVEELELGGVAQSVGEEAGV